MLAFVRSSRLAGLIFTVTHTPRTSTIGGGAYSKKLLERLTVDSGSTRRDEHAYKGHSPEWAKFIESGGLKVENFARKFHFFSPLGALDDL